MHCALPTAAAVEPVHTSQFPGNTVGGHHVRTTRESDHPGFIHTTNANWPKFLSKLAPAHRMEGAANTEAHESVANAGTRRPLGSSATC